MSNRWIGFDMDECIGSVMPLYAFVTYFSSIANSENRNLFSDVLATIANRLVDSERARQTKLLRPSMFGILQMVYNASKQKQIEGAFIYSNNGSKELVQFMGFFLNMYILRVFDKERTESPIFQMSSWFGQKERLPYGYTKNFEGIQTCLLAKGLPPCSSIHDLLFFDDISHDLEREIPNYVRIQPYSEPTNIQNLIEVFQPMAKYIPEREWGMLVATAQKTTQKRSVNLPFPNTEDEKVFRNAFTKFLYKHTGASRKKQRKQTKHKTMKVRKKKVI